MEKKFEVLMKIWIELKAKRAMVCGLLSYATIILGTVYFALG